MTITGAASLYGIYAPDDVPEVKAIAFDIVDFYRNTTEALSDNFRNSTDDHRWQYLQPTLRLLKDVCPEAEAWVRQKHKDGLLFYTEGNTDHIAAYSPFLKHLIFNESMFRMGDGQKASILAHEFRHSRQSYSKFVIAGIWLLVSGDLPTELYEREAEAYQQKVLFALRGVHIYH